MHQSSTHQPLLARTYSVRCHFPNRNKLATLHKHFEHLTWNSSNIYKRGYSNYGKYLYLFVRSYLCYGKYTSNIYRGKACESYHILHAAVETITRCVSEIADRGKKFIALPVCIKIIVVIGYANNPNIFSTVFL